MEFAQCPLYEQCKNISEQCKNISGNLVQKETCEFRWELISIKFDELKKSADNLTELTKNVDIIKHGEQYFSDFTKSIETRQGIIEKKIEKLITRNVVNDEQTKIHLEHKKRKQHIRDTIITTVLIAFIIGILAGGWEMFKKVSIILEKTQQSQPTKQIKPKVIIPKTQLYYKIPY